MKIKALILKCLLMVFAMSALLSPKAYAAKQTFIVDEKDVLQDEEALTVIAERIHEQTGYGVCAALVEEIEGDSIYDYAESYYDKHFSYDKGCLLMVDLSSNYFNVYDTGWMSDEAFDKLVKIYLEAESYDQGIKNYLNLAYELLTDGEVDTNIPQEHQKALIVDESGVLSASEISDLTDAASAVSKEYQCDVAVVFVDDVAGQSVQEYANDYYDYNGYGYGSNDSGILLLIATKGREYAMSTYGYGAIAFTDYGLEKIEDHFMPYLRDNDWYGAARSFIEDSRTLLESAANGQVVDRELRQKPSLKQILSPVHFIVSIIIGFLLSFGPIAVMKRQLKSVHRKSTAGAYLKETRITVSRDQFIRSMTSKVRISKPKSSSGGSRHGSTTHRSSSGRSHGGRSGKF